MAGWFNLVESLYTAWTDLELTILLCLPHLTLLDENDSVLQAKAKDGAEEWWRTQLQFKAESVTKALPHLLGPTPAGLQRKLVGSKESWKTPMLSWGCRSVDGVLAPLARIAP